MRIRSSSFDLFAGETSEPNNLFFRPTPHKDYNVAESGIDIDDFTRYPRSQLRFDALVRKYVQYARILSMKFERPYEYLLLQGPRQAILKQYTTAERLLILKTPKGLLGTRNPTA